MKNQYETVFIVTPVLSDLQVKETVKKFRDIITEQVQCNDAVRTHRGILA